MWSTEAPSTSPGTTALLEPVFSMLVLLSYEINYLVPCSNKYHRPQNVQLVCKFKMCSLEAAVSPQQCDGSLASLAMISLWFYVLGEMSTPNTFAGLPLDGAGNTDFSCTQPEPTSVHVQSVACRIILKNICGCSGPRMNLF